MIEKFKRKQFVRLGNIVKDFYTENAVNDQFQFHLDAFTSYKILFMSITTMKYLMIYLET